MLSWDAALFTHKFGPNTRLLPVCFLSLEVTAIEGHCKPSWGTARLLRALQVFLKTLGKAFLMFAKFLNLGHIEESFLV